MLAGRFAPSPTGPLHMGSLVTALASFLDMRQRGGDWFVRIDDLDPPRQDPQATSQILASLEAHGLVGDQPVDYQSTHDARYAQAFKQVDAHVFYCACTRKQVAAHPVYPGTCRARTQPQADTAARMRVGETVIAFADERHGPQDCPLATQFGDFIVKRRDSLWAYNFATAVDDGFDATHVLRGDDLFHVTPLQIYVMQLLGLETPHYAHIPVLCFADGTKLSKQTHAPALRNDTAAANLRRALHYLGLQPPSEDSWNVSQWLTWGVAHWRLESVPDKLAPFTEAAV